MRRSRLGGWTAWIARLTPCVVLLVPGAATAQSTGSTTATVRVLDAGAILDVSPLEVVTRERGGDARVAGTVTFRQNGRYLLQVKLDDSGDGSGSKGPTLAYDVQAVVGGTLIRVGSAAWVTVARGPGTAGTTVGVEYLLGAGPGGARNSSAALTPPLVYQVVPAGGS